MEVAKIHFDEVILFSQRNPQTTIKDVRFVPYDQDAPSVQAFYEEMKKRSTSKALSLVKRRNQFAGLASEEMNLAVNTSLELVIYAGCQKDLNKAVNDIDEIMRDKSTKQVIERHAITKLSLEHSRRIHAIGLRYDVEASIESTVGRIVISGQTDDILNTMGEIYKLLDQVKEEDEELKTAEALSKVTQWKFKDCDTGSFEPFEPLINVKIEAAYDKMKPTVDIADGLYRVHFKTMVMEEIQDSNGTDVRRENQSKLHSNV